MFLAGRRRKIKRILCFSQKNTEERTFALQKPNLRFVRITFPVHRALKFFVKNFWYQLNQYFIKIFTYKFNFGAGGFAVCTGVFVAG